MTGATRKHYVVLLDKTEVAFGIWIKNETIILRVTSDKADKDGILENLEILIRRREPAALRSSPATGLLLQLIVRSFNSALSLSLRLLPLSFLLPALAVISQSQSDKEFERKGSNSGKLVDRVQRYLRFYLIDFQ